LPTRWKGYIHFLDLVAQKEAFLEITPAAFSRLEKEVPKEGNLRGLRIQAKRSPGGNQGRLILNLFLWTGDIKSLPAPRDPEPILELLWTWRR
jgi:hypothetical protein